MIATNAIYADAMLGKCPACDDFIRDSRVLEIEARQLENRERGLNVERARIQNAILENDPVPKRVVRFEGLPPESTLHVHLRDGEESPKTVVEVKPSGNTSSSCAAPVTVDIWSERRGDWKPTQIYKQDITAYCPVDMSNWLSPEEKHVVATLFSEGGSDARGMAPDELVRVMWCIEHRLQLLLALDRALSDDPRDAVAKGRLGFEELGKERRSRMGHIPADVRRFRRGRGRRRAIGRHSPV